MQDDTARADLGVATDLDIAEHFCPSAQQHAVAHFRMPVATLLASAAERYLMPSAVPNWSPLEPMFP